MKITSQPPPRQLRRRIGLTLLTPQKAAQADRDSWICDLTDAEFARMLGPSWAMMTERQRALYPNLPDEEMDSLWGDSEDANRDIA